MTDNQHNLENDALDRQLDAALSNYAAVEPRVGIEERVLANLRAQREHAPARGNEIKIGTRVPVQSKDGEFQYLDIGTNIFARLGETRGQTELVVRAEISNFAAADHDPRDLHPVIRQMKIGGSTLLPLGKTIVIGSADDPNSKRQFQLEVTVTKMK